jgi:HK97 family phage major capsid protein
VNLKEMRAAALKAAQDIVAKAKAEARDLTAEEITEVETKSAEVKEIDGKIERAAKSADLIKSLGGLAPTETTTSSTQVKASRNLGEHAAQALGEKLRGVKGSRFSLSTPEYKAYSDTQVTGGESGVFGPVLTDVDRNIVTAVRRRLTVADLLGVETISGTAITYFVEGALEGDFTTVGENAQKPQLHFAQPTPVTEALKKIAGFIKESDEILEDMPWYASVINGRLLYQLGLIEENQLLAGDGNGTNLSGILDRAIQSETSAGATDDADAIFRAMTKVSVGSTLDADGLVIHPTDYQNLRLAKDSNDQYYGGGFFAGQYGQGGIIMQPPVWGLRTVVTPAIPAGTALVGAFAQAGSVIRKGGVRVESTNTDEDDFTNNRITIRAEERLTLAVRRPYGFVEVTLTAAGSGS